MTQTTKTKRDAKAGREKLERIIEMLTAIEAHAVDPFLLEVDDVIKVVKEYFPDWEKPEDLNLDAETIHHLASVIKLQSEWVKHRSTSLYADPFLLEERIVAIPKEDMVGIFLKAWHPIVELEQLSIHSLAEAMRYWQSLVPLSERWKELAPDEVEAGMTSRDEMIKQRVLSDKVFSEELEEFWLELQNCVAEKGADGKLSYWDFVGSETYEQTVQRALMTSFLITYGYATLEIHPLEELVFVKPFERAQTKPRKEQAISVPLSVSFENWQKWRKGELD